MSSDAPMKSTMIGTRSHIVAHVAINTRPPAQLAIEASIKSIFTGSPFEAPLKLGAYFVLSSTLHRSQHRDPAPVLPEPPTLLRLNAGRAALFFGSIGR